LIIDAAGLSTSEYDIVVKDFLHDLGREGACTVGPLISHPSQKLIDRVSGSTTIGRTRKPMLSVIKNPPTTCRRRRLSVSQALLSSIP
jgi:hypothetical protein